MKKLSLKIQFWLFVICLFFIGLGIHEIYMEGIKKGLNLFFQISPIVPFVFSAFVFGTTIYSKKKQKV